MSQKIKAARLDQLRITEKTVWSFVRLETESGLTGCGEATVPQGHAGLRDAARRWLPPLVGETLDGLKFMRAVNSDAPLADNALLCALDMAAHDLEGQILGKPVYDILGGAKRHAIELYANINRTTTDRSPSGFAASATRARAQGFSTFKIAPFDEITPDVCATADFEAQLAKGLERIAATREAVGPQSRLRVDCHWRFTAAAAAAMIAAVNGLQLDWIECPIAEDPHNAPDIADLRRLAHRQEIRLAGLEMGTGVEAFMPFLRAGSYDVIMPDVKYLGGLRVVAELQAVCDAHGAVVSPHNPSGPICHAASLHACAALPRVELLEMQFDESPWFDGILAGPGVQRSGGFSAPPSGPGLGVALSPEAIQPLRIDDVASF